MSTTLALTNNPSDVDQTHVLSLWETYRLIPGLLTDRAEVLAKVARKYPGIVYLRLPGKPMYLVSSAVMARHVLDTNEKNYRKSFDFKIVGLLLGDGPVTSHGDVWRLGRKAGRPALTQRASCEAAATIVTVTKDTLATWGNGKPIAINEAFTELTLRVFTKAFLATELGDTAKPIAADLTVALRYLNDRLFDVVQLPWSPKKRRFEKVKKRLDQAVMSWVDARLTDGYEGKGDLLSTLIGVSFNEELVRKDEQRTWLRDQLMTYLIAGHETVATTLSWTLYLLAGHPDIADKLRNEVDEVLKGSPPVTRSALEALTYTDAVLREAMRLLPPVWSLGREAIEGDVLGDMRIPKGSTVVVSQYAIQRNDRHWANAEKFDPDRAPVFEAGAGPLKYFPFSAGGRFCVGEQAAMIEMKVVLSMIMMKFMPKLSSQGRIGHEALIALRPKPDILLNFVPRHRVM